MNTTGIIGYREYLVRRDGDADLLNRSSPAGRVSSQIWKPIPFAPRILSIERFSSATYDADGPNPGWNRKTLFLLATAKLNQAERFGVGLGVTYGHNSGDDVPPERVYMELEEHYHTRILADVLDIFGVPFQVVAPPFVMRQFVKTAVFLPERLSFMFVGAAEMAGCIMFHELRRIGIELFADEPEVAARIERLYSEILTDEVGHVGYCAARCTPAERAVMRQLYPRIGRLFARQTFEISLLTNRQELHALLDRPFDVGELSAGLPTDTFLAAHP